MMLKPCPFCHEDLDGYVLPIEKNCHAFIRYPNKMVVSFGRNRRECEINYCPMCGRKLRRAEGGADNDG